MDRRKRGAPEATLKLPVAEKVISKRQCDGRIEFLIKWKDEEIEESTWEPEENLSCSALIAEYERERRQTQILKAEPVNDDKTVDRIVGMCEEAGERYFLVKFKNNMAQLVLAKEANKLYTEAIVRFYEENLQFEP